MDTLPEPKLKRLINLISFVVLGIGIAIFLKPLHVDLINSLSSYGDPSLEIKTLILVFSCILARAFWTMKLWSRQYLFVFLWFCLDFIFVPILIFGFSTREWESGALLIVFSATGLFLLTPSIKKIFPRQIKYFLICGVLALLFGYKAIIPFVANLYFPYKLANDGFLKVPLIEKKVINLKKDFEIPKAFNFPLPFEFSFRVPQGVRLMLISRGKGGKGYVLFQTNCNSPRGLIEVDDFFKLEKIKNEIGYADSDYSFLKRLLTEKWGLIFPIYRDTLISILPKDKIIRVFETRINGFSAFVIEGIQKKGVNDNFLPCRSSSN
jgi:hypothetical protein